MKKMNKTELHKLFLSHFPVVLWKDPVFEIYDELNQPFGNERIQPTLTQSLNQRMDQPDRFIATSFEENGLVRCYRCYYYMEHVPDIIVMISTGNLQETAQNIVLSANALQRKGLKTYFYNMEHEPEEIMWSNYIKEAFRTVLLEDRSLRLRFVTGELTFQ